MSSYLELCTGPSQKRHAPKRIPTAFSLSLSLSLSLFFLLVRARESKDTNPSDLLRVLSSKFIFWAECSGANEPVSQLPWINEKGRFQKAKNVLSYAIFRLSVKKENSVFSHGALSTISRDISVKLKRAPSSQAKATAIQLQCSCARCLFKPKKKRARVACVGREWTVEC